MAQSIGHGQDTERFSRLFVDGQREVLRYILALVPDIDDAHEILQETAVDLLKKFDRYDPAFPFAPWACRFAFLRVLKFREERSRRGRCLSLDLVEQLAAERIEKSEALEERRLVLAACLKRMSAFDRLLIEQRYVHQLCVAEIADATGQNVSTLYKALERIRGRLIECVDGRLGNGSHC